MKDWLEWWLMIAIWLVLTVFLIFTGGCKSQPQIVTEYRDRVTHDTLTQVDSVYIARYVRERGDTVHIYDTILRFKYLDKVRDVHVHDSIPYEVTVQVPVHSRNGYDRFTSWGFWILLALILLRVAWWLFKTFYLRR